MLVSFSFIPKKHNSFQCKKTCLFKQKCSEIVKRQNTDDNFGKTECVNPEVYCHRLPSSTKKGKLSKSEKKKKRRIKWEPQTNCVITVSMS